MNLIDIKDRIKKDSSLSKLHEWVAQTFSKAEKDPGHDMSHFYRVALWAIRLGENKFSDRAAIAAALLHDIVNLPKNSPDRARASELSANLAAEILPEYSFLPDEVADICSAIRTHSFSRGEDPESFLGRALQDADRLEAIGAIGLYRVFVVGAKLGAEFFHSSDPFAKTRSLDDKSYSVDHFFTKLLKLVETMKTVQGRIEAQKRTEVLSRYLDSLRDELGENC